MKKLNQLNVGLVLKNLPWSSSMESAPHFASREDWQDFINNYLNIKWLKEDSQNAPYNLQINDSMTATTTIDVSQVDNDQLTIIDIANAPYCVVKADDDYRFYFVTKSEVLNNNVIRLSLTLDILTTYPIGICFDINGIIVERRHFDRKKYLSMTIDNYISSYQLIYNDPINFAEEFDNQLLPSAYDEKIANCIGESNDLFENDTSKNYFLENNRGWIYVYLSPTGASEMAFSTFKIGNIDLGFVLFTAPLSKEGMPTYVTLYSFNQNPEHDNRWEFTTKTIEFKIEDFYNYWRQGTDYAKTLNFGIAKMLNFDSATFGTDAAQSHHYPIEASDSLIRINVLSGTKIPPTGTPIYSSSGGTFELKLIDANFGFVFTDESGFNLRNYKKGETQKERLNIEWPHLAINSYDLPKEIGKILEVKCLKYPYYGFGIKAYENGISKDYSLFDYNSTINWNESANSYQLSFDYRFNSIPTFSGTQNEVTIADGGFYHDTAIDGQNIVWTSNEDLPVVTDAWIEYQQANKNYAYQGIMLPAFQSVGSAVAQAGAYRYETAATSIIGGITRAANFLYQIENLQSTPDTIKQSNFNFFPNYVIFEQQRPWIYKKQLKQQEWSRVYDYFYRYGYLLSMVDSSKNWFSRHDFAYIKTAETAEDKIEGTVFLSQEQRRKISDALQSGMTFFEYVDGTFYSKFDRINAEKGLIND